ncbi:MAG TPA: tRNA modification GTPase [Gemmata sp.]|jgi:tRNA modification GTPase|nr:tRNA modification GTPase [Gemmata sp.]
MSLTASNAAIHPDDTIVALSSAHGSGKRAIVRISGPNTTAAINAIFTHSDPRESSARSRRLVPGFVRLKDVFSPVPASLYFFPGPKTYTGQDIAELHTLGSPPLVERLVSDLLNAGTRPARPGEFTLRAFLAGKKDLPQAEAVNAVIEAGTEIDLRLALTQLAGGVTQPLHTLREELLNLLADVEAALDFADEDIEFVGRSETLARLAAALGQLTDLQRQLDERTVSGRSVRVALVGLPNVGKSSLFNALGGSEAIVSPIPGTTRDYLTKQINFDGMTVELIDTAGWQTAADTIEEQAQQLGREQTGRADVILWCVEVGSEFTPTAETTLAETGAKVIRVWTKCDLWPKETGNRRQEDACEDANPTQARSASEGCVVPRWRFGLIKGGILISKSPLPISVSVMSPGGTDELRSALVETVSLLMRSPLAPSQSRCRHHVAACIAELSRARDHVAENDPPELTAVSLRIAVDQLGEMTGAVYTNDLLDRIFSRFCIGK